MKKNLGQKYLDKAKKIIPGGNQLLSKRSELFLPKLWPNYYKKAKGCVIWDLNNKPYYDFAGMGVTACTLGYSNNKINSAINSAVKSGSLTTLNALEEYDLAKIFLNIHKWASMAKFCKSGGEACLTAIRIARAYSKKEKIAFCGYHGWHDWYISANLENKKNLNNQLLPGLKTEGVSKSFKGSIFPFNYNDIESLKKILKKKEIGIIIMEPMRSSLPKNNFLNEVRKLANKYKCILIFDEITSGFHDHYGGVHLKLNVIPDIAIFGKSIANGYPISAIIGKKKIMNKSQDSFISSTMWTDKIGFVASIKTLQYMKKNKVQTKIVKIGKSIKKFWEKSCQKHNVKIVISGQNSMPYISFGYNNNLEISTFFTQEMLKKGFLASNLVSVTEAYNDQILEKYKKNFDLVMHKISNILKKNKKFPLMGPIKHSTFKRLT
jgi:glutamate-1-semialdehyde aminotransferase